jgi:hypothetical protein
VTDFGVIMVASDVGGGRLVATVTDPDGNVLGLFRTDDSRPRSWRQAHAERRWRRGEPRVRSEGT